MLYHERAAEILRLAQLQNIVKIQELMKHLHVSVDTVRRDLRQMEEEGQIKCIRGGACLPDALSSLSNFSGREIIHIEGKQQAAKKALRYVQQGMTIAMNSGTTNTVLAQELASKTVPLTVITNNLAAAQILMQNAKIRLIVIGGTVDPEERSTYGAACEAEFRTYLPDLAFLSINAVSLEEGFTDFRYHEISILQLLAQRAQRVIAVMDASKLGRQSKKTVLQLSQVDRLVMDCLPTDAICRAYEKAGIQIE